MNVKDVQRNGKLTAPTFASGGWKHARLENAFRKPGLRDELRAAQRLPHRIREARWFRVLMLGDDVENLTVPGPAWCFSREKSKIVFTVLLVEPRQKGGDVRGHLQTNRRSQKISSNQQRLDKQQTLLRADFLLVITAPSDATWTPRKQSGLNLWINQTHQCRLELLDSVVVQTQKGRGCLCFWWKPPCRDSYSHQGSDNLHLNVRVCRSPPPFVHTVINPETEAVGVGGRGERKQEQPNHFSPLPWCVSYSPL